MSQLALSRAVKKRPIGLGGRLDRWARRLVLGQLQRLQRGTICLVEGEQRRTFGQGEDGPTVVLQVHHPRFFRALALGGTIGAAEAYMQGWWSCDDLPAMCRLAVANMEWMQQRERGWARLAAPARMLGHALKRNTLRGSRRNIAAHYDLSNDFFRLFLDDNMMYSSAVFPRPDSSLEEASRYKVDRICKKLALVPEDHLLEIGTGWGGFALHAAREYGCRVTTATISQQQCELARQRVHTAGLDGRVEVVLADYRDLQGQYDKLVSIEMIEAVGHHYFDTYFGCCARLLKPEGLMLLQAIVIGDWAYERALRSVDFIKAYIFPGSCIPSVATISRSLAAATDMRLVHLEDIGPHYARTLRAWRVRFWDAEEQVRQLGFTEEFIRMWDFYFAYCIGGFEERYISDVQMLLARPANRRSAQLPEIGHGEV
ncbi:MAG: class I SAM-dependent methyltransferase [Gemmatimonadetes bacterium]|nr:class I SAM-dependent methyltransferase [Gemmatimonadota bacterium]